MRAARVLDMLLVLERSGKTTARALAQRMEVSQRTILRDVEALSEAGVPIIATRGSRGGIELLHGFKTHLTALTAEEAACLYLIGQPLVAERLGLAAPTRNARNKLLNALSYGLAEQANLFGNWFLHDPEPQGGSRIPSGELRRLVSCIRERRAVEITLGVGTTRKVHPLGLVLNAGSWIVAVSGTDGPEFVCIDDLRSTRLTNQRFVPPEEFDVGPVWTRHGGMKNAGVEVPTDFGHSVL
jgi:predicted DNA-binding transcriptional regulator YafY